MSNKIERVGGSDQPTWSAEPEIHYIGDVTAIGILHSTKLPEKGKLKQFTGLFRGVDYLLVEGDSSVLKARDTTRPSGYEDVAVQTFKRRNRLSSVFPLEQSVDNPSLLQEYGMERDTYMAYMVKHGTYSLMETVSSMTFCTGNQRLDMVEKTALRLKRAVESESVTVADISSAINKNLTGIDKNNYKAMAARADVEGVIAIYAARVRDYEIIGPNIARLATELSGRKAIIVGKNHIPAVKRALRGIPIDRPMPWDEYKATLDPKTQNSIAEYERIARGTS